MTRTQRQTCYWWLAAVLLTITVAGIGCSPISTLGFLIGGPSPTDAAFNLSIPDKESKVVFICTHGNSAAVNSAFHGADEQICSRLVSLLALRYQETKDKIKIVPVNKVYSYIQDHPEWAMLSKADVGKHFGADFVVCLELGPMTMFEKDSGRTLYRGNVEVDIRVFKMNDTDGFSTEKRETHYPCQYPTNHPEDATGGNQTEFRAKFLERIAKGLVPFFASHVDDNKMKMGDD